MESLLSRCIRSSKPKKEYHLTQKGTRLVPVLVEMIIWSAQYDESLNVPTGFVEKVRLGRLSVLEAITSKILISNPHKERLN